MNVFRINPADLTLRNASLAAPLSQQQLVQALAIKAEKFVTAALMDLDVPVDLAESKALQLAVLQDFIEVHNEAVNSAPIVLPEDKEHVDALLFGNVERTRGSRALALI
jgi:hypothetical protein